MMRPSNQFVLVQDYQVFCPSVQEELNLRSPRMKLLLPSAVQVQLWKCVLDTHILVQNIYLDFATLFIFVPNVSSWLSRNLTKESSAAICHKRIVHLHLSAFSWRSAKRDIFSSSNNKLDWVFTLSVLVTFATLNMVPILLVLYIRLILKPTV